MSRSTTATTTYDLVKYSRSSANARSEAEQEWQHFTNPTITLVVDAKRVNSGELESLRTRVIWAISAGRDAMDVDQGEVVFEDLDMHVLSLTPPTHGLPLKAVYRDTVVGIRYMHPRTVPVGTAPTFRRFQITFQTAALAAAFIDSVKLICPCKANPVPVARNAQMARSKTVVPGAASTPAMPTPLRLVGPGLPPRTPTRIQPPTSQATDWRTPYHDSTACSQVTGSSSQAAFPVEKLPALTDRLAHAYMPSQAHAAFAQSGPSFAAVPDAAMSSQAVPPPSATAYSQPSAGVPPRPSQSSQPPEDPRYSRPSSTSRPSSARAADYSGYPYSDLSQPRSGSQFLDRPGSGHTTASMPMSQAHDAAYSSGHIALSSAPAPTVLPPRLPPVPVLYAHPPPLPPVTAPEVSATAPARSHESSNLSDRQLSAPSQILSALEDTQSVYDLSRGELEDLVARVVREDGFAMLLEKVDSMWAIKGCLNRTTL